MAHALSHALGRLILVPLGFVLAVATALAVLLLIGLERITHASAAIPMVEWLPALLSGGLRMTAGMTLIPALAVIIVGEIARIRSWLYYLAGGGLALAVLPFMGVLESGSSMTAADSAIFSALWQVLATAGFAGGLVYWLVAGRSA
jgi:hypothetical protein